MKKIKNTENSIVIEFDRFEALMIMCALGTEVDKWQAKNEENCVSVMSKIDKDFLAILDK